MSATSSDVLSEAPAITPEDGSYSGASRESRPRKSTRLGPATSLEIACAACALILFIVEKLRVVRGIGMTYTTEDQTIFWWVAQDYLRFRFHEPLFYGTPYSSHLESALAAPLLLLGASSSFSIQFVTALLTAAPFLLLAFITWRRGLYISSILVLSSQFLLPVAFGALATQAAQPTGAAVGGIAAALLFSPIPRPLKFFQFGVLGTLGLCLHPNSIYVVGPAGAYLVLTRYRDRWLWICAGIPTLALAIAYYFAVRFYTTHPSYLLHAQWPVDFQWSAFMEGLRHLDRHLGDLTPTQFHASGFMLLMVAAAIWRALQTGDWKRLVATFVLVGGVLVSLAITKVHNGSDSFTFPYSRAFYSYPLGVLWLVVLWAEVTPSPSGADARRAVVLGASLLVALGLWRAFSLRDEMDDVLAVPQTVVHTARTTTVLGDCRRLRAIAEANQVDLVMHAGSRVEAYACGAEWYGQLDNIYPPYDRRTALVLNERDRIRSKILITEPDARVCVTARKRGLQCEMLETEPRTALVVSPMVSALTVADWLKIPVRHL